MICKWLETADAQQVFNKAYLGLMAQGEPSMSVGGRCYYRHPERNLKCAAGFLITDEEVSETSEGSWVELIYSEIVPSNHSDLICGMQRIHDKYCIEKGEFRAYIKQKFSVIAEKHGLVVPEFSEPFSD